MVKKYKKLILLACLIVALILPQMILAANPALNTLDNIASGDKGPYASVAAGNNLNAIIGTVISIGLGLIGIIFLVLMIYAGYNWMTARGEEEKVAAAKETITRAVVGIIIVIGAYAVWRFIFVRLLF